jgi:glucose 1-dehydrogenase
LKRKLEGQNALVTGASSGIGRAIAISLGMEGANVAINFHSEEKEAKEVREIILSQNVKALIMKADISKENEVVEMFRQANEKLGAIDILICNAGIQSDSKFVDMSLKMWEDVINVNLTGQFLCAREAVREFLKKRKNKNCIGKIIFISSVHDKIPWSGHVNYAASKGGVMQLMKSLSLELAPHHIRINSISPGAIKTNINVEAWDNPESEKKLLELIPYGRVGEPGDIGNVAAWLVSDEADYINGATIYVDGGMTLYPGFAHGG